MLKVCKGIVRSLLEPKKSDNLSSFLSKDAYENLILMSRYQGIPVEKMLTEAIRHEACLQIAVRDGGKVLLKTGDEVKDISSNFRKFQ